MTKKSIYIIGGGASGFFCAANLDPSQYDITILEKNKEVLQKVKISGGGRCNVTHACFDPRELVTFYPRGHKELRSVFAKFQPGDTMAWFEDRNVPLKIEDDLRVFPESNKSQSVIDCFEKACQENNVRVITQAAVKEITRHDDKFSISTKEEIYSADYVIFTTGNAPSSMKLVQNLGHSITPLVPSLFTFNIKDPILEDLPGTTFPYAEVSIPSLKTDEVGPLLITHWGLSGPAILKISAWKAVELNALKYKFPLKVNFIGMNPNDAKECLIDYRKEYPKKSMKEAKAFEITNRFWQRVLWLAKVDPEKSISNLNNKEMQRIVDELCSKTLTVNGKSTNKDEFVTAGGVELKEIDFKNMSSKLVPNLFLAGEVLNIDAVTGGFNFQACWSESWLIASYLNNIKDQE